MNVKHYLDVESGVRPYQVLQRDANGSADMCFAGTTTAPDGAIVSGRLLRFGQPVPDFPWTEVSRVEAGRFAGRLGSVPAGGEYTLELRTQDQAGQATGMTTCDGILIGDLWILAGQSNMQGAGRLDSPYAEKPSPLVHAFDMCDRWVTACDPLHWRIQSVDPVHHAAQSSVTEKAILAAHRDCAAGVGPGLRFARQMVRQTGVPVGLLPCAVGGASMAQWDPAEKGLEGGSLYGAMLRRFRAVGGRIAGLLWYQGEAETSGAATQQFASSFRQFVESVRCDMERPDLPFFYVQIGRFVIDDPQRMGWNAVQEVQRLFAEEVANADVVPAVDLELGDGVHLSTYGHYRLGRRLAIVALRRLFGRDDLKLGPRLDRIVVEAPALVRVCYREANGALTAGSEISGFSIRDAEGKSHDLIYHAEVDPEATSSVLLKLDRALPPESYLWYGYGMHPWCNLTDEMDMGAPAFGPVPLGH